MTQRDNAGKCCKLCMPCQRRRKRLCSRHERPRPPARRRQQDRTCRQPQTGPALQHLLRRRPAHHAHRKRGRRRPRPPASRTRRPARRRGSTRPGPPRRPRRRQGSGARNRPRPAPPAPGRRPYRLARLVRRVRQAEPGPLRHRRAPARAGRRSGRAVASGRLRQQQRSRIPRPDPAAGNRRRAGRRAAHRVRRQPGGDR